VGEAGYEEEEGGVMGALWDLMKARFTMPDPLPHASHNDQERQRVVERIAETVKCASEAWRGSEPKNDADLEKSMHAIVWREFRERGWGCLRGDDFTISVDPEKSGNGRICWTFTFSGSVPLDPVPESECRQSWKVKRETGE
jgi:hypothetical protein